MSSSVLGIEALAVRKRDKNPCLHAAYILVGDDRLYISIYQMLPSVMDQNEVGNRIRNFIKG